MKSDRVSPWVYFLLVFVGGIFTGFFGDRVFATRTASANTSPRGAEEWKRHYLNDLKRCCQLTQEQLHQADQVLESTHKEADQIRRRITPDMESLHKQQVRQVRDLLTDAQKPAYDAFRAERDAQRKASHH